jgi:hypothetical protein
VPSGANPVEYMAETGHRQHVGIGAPSCRRVPLTPLKPRCRDPRPVPRWPRCLGVVHLPEPS